MRELSPLGTTSIALILSRGAGGKSSYRKCVGHTSVVVGLGTMPHALRYVFLSLELIT